MVGPTNLWIAWFPGYEKIVFAFILERSGVRSPRQFQDAENKNTTRRVSKPNNETVFGRSGTTGNKENGNVSHPSVKSSSVDTTTNNSATTSFESASRTTSIKENRETKIRREISTSTKPLVISDARGKQGSNGKGLIGWILYRGVSRIFLKIVKMSHTNPFYRVRGWVGWFRGCKPLPHKKKKKRKKEGF